MNSVESSLLAGHAVRRSDILGNAERDHHRSKTNLVAVNEPARRCNWLLANEGAVLAPEILDGGVLPGDDEPGVVPRDAWYVNPHRCFGRSPEDVFTSINGDLPRRPNQPVPDRRRCPRAGVAVQDFA